MNFAFSPDEMAFRDEVRAFLDERLTERLREGARATPTVFAEPDISLEWQQILNEKGWLGYNWPKEHGGTGWSPGNATSSRRNARWRTRRTCRC